MPPLNISDPDFTYDSEDPEGYRAGMYRLGPHVGAERTGATVYDLPAGELLCPYHYEYGEEEWLLVLSGRPFLRTPSGTEELEPMDVAFFRRGPEGARRVGWPLVRREGNAWPQTSSKHARSTSCAPSRWTPSSAPTRVTPGRPWRWRRWSTCCSRV